MYIDKGIIMDSVWKHVILFYFLFILFLMSFSFYKMSKMMDEDIKLKEKTKIRKIMTVYMLPLIILSGAGLSSNTNLYRIIFLLSLFLYLFPIFWFGISDWTSRLRDRRRTWQTNGKAEIAIVERPLSHTIVAADAIIVERQSRAMQRRSHFPSGYR